MTRVETVTSEDAAAGPSSFVTSDRAIRLDDQCEAESFNEVLGPGACTSRNGGVDFDRFIALLTKTQSVGPWRITPSVLEVEEGETLPVMNMGSEAHTYTEVEEFGGGVEPALNELSGNPDVAPECAALASGDFIAPGQSVDHTFEEEGVERYQCCIHPWMRQIVRTKGR
ncbi:MAG TPA: hypothetical protein VE173_05810 [Longimicrobiales bacterium]|nr:hypothetical protein [Longimicrobiales bacterium]